MAWDAFGSAVVEQLVSRLASFLEERHKLQSDVEFNLEKLKEQLMVIKSIAEATEGREIKNKNLVDWLKELKYVVKEANDLMRAIESQCTERMAASSSSNIFKRVCAATITVSNVLLPRDDHVKLSKLVDKVERITHTAGSSVSLFILDPESNRPGITGICPTTALLTNKHTLVGREKDKEEFIRFLLTREQHGVRNVPVLPILGYKGIGKTTLAQIVYNDKRSQSHFSFKMWVCVSESFDLDKITRETLDQADSQAGHSSVMNFNRLQEILIEKLSKETFLLIIDDVQNITGKEVWERLKAPLNYGKEGSKILLTSRIENVAKLMGTKDPIKLEGLPKQENWSLFKECAFDGANLEEHPELVTLGEEIVSKLNGSPLATENVGAILKGNLNVDYWKSIYKSMESELELDQNGMA